MEFRCKLSEVNDLEFRLRNAVKEPMRTFEVPPTEESFGWGRSMVCEHDYTVHVPELKLFFRDAVEFEFNEEEQEEMPIEAILHCYRDISPATSRLTGPQPFLPSPHPDREKRQSSTL